MTALYTGGISRSKKEMVIMTPAEKPRHQAICFEEVSRKITKAPPRPVLLPARQENKNGLQKPGRAGDSIIIIWLSTELFFINCKKGEVQDLSNGTKEGKYLKRLKIFFLSSTHGSARVPFRGIHFFVAPIKLPKSLFNTRSFFCCMIAM